MNWRAVSRHGSLAVLMLLACACESTREHPRHAESGALAGGVFGAATGAMIGGSHGHAGEGALAGAAVGAIAGGLVGHVLDDEEQARLRQQAPQTYVRVDQGQPLSVADVKALAKANVGDEVILSQIRITHSVYHLGANEIIDLSSAGVSSRVIDAMIHTPDTLPPEDPQPPTVAPPPAPSETVIVAPGPDFVWILGEWSWRGRWVWLGGHWIQRPFPRASWVPGAWVHGRHGYRHFPGHWH